MAKTQTLASLSAIVAAQDCGPGTAQNKHVGVVIVQRAQTVRSTSGQNGSLIFKGGDE